LTWSELDEGEPSLRLAVQEAVFAHATQAGWQDVQEHVPEEVGDGQGAGGVGAGLCVAIAEGDGAAGGIVVDQIVLADDAAVEIAGEVLERVLAAPSAGTNTGRARSRWASQAPPPARRAG